MYDDQCGIIIVPTILILSETKRVLVLQRCIFDIIRKHFSVQKECSNFYVELDILAYLVGTLFDMVFDFLYIGLISVLNR